MLSTDRDHAGLVLGGGIEHGSDGNIRKRLVMKAPQHFTSAIIIEVDFVTIWSKSAPALNTSSSGGYKENPFKTMLIERAGGNLK